MNYAGTEWTQQVANLPGGSACLVRVIATDGLNTGYDVSDKTFSVAGKGPTVWIDTPRDHQTFKAGEPIWLSGSGFDLEDGALAASLQWTIVGLGFVGSGSDVILPELSPGFYTVVLETFDQEQTKGSTSVEILVSPLGEAPRLKIQPGSKDVLLSWPVLATGYTLESASEIGPKANWAPAPQPLRVNGDDVVVSSDIDTDRRFFRLRQSSN